MLKDWTAMAAELSGDIRALRAGSPEVMKGFSALAQAALKADALDTRTKELIALAIAVATRCDGCIAFHAEAAMKQGATRAPKCSRRWAWPCTWRRPERDVRRAGAGGVRSVQRKAGDPGGVTRQASCTLLSGDQTTKSLPIPAVLSAVGWRTQLRPRAGPHIDADDHTRQW